MLIDEVYSRSKVNWPADLTDDMRVPGQINHPRIETSFKEIISNGINI